MQENCVKPPLIILTGPTAVGKTRLSISLAKAISGSIISADSMQVYRHMDIGSAKVREDEREGIPHYLIDVLSPTEPFHVLRFQEMAKEAADRIRKEGRIPIVTGGTGFYIQALLYDIDFTEGGEESGFRASLEELEKKEGAGALHKMLLAIDPESADAIHPHNIKRIIRALEYHHQMGGPISAHNREEREKESPYAFRYFVLTMDRERLYQRINARVDQMMEEGFLDEVKALRDLGCTSSMTSMQGIGYKELFACLEEGTDLEEAIRRIKTNSRHYAKRQLTWFRRERDVIWLKREDYQDDEQAILSAMLQRIKEIIP